MATLPAAQLTGTGRNRPTPGVMGSDHTASCGVKAPCTAIVILVLVGGIHAQQWHRAYPLENGLVAGDLMFDGETWTFDGTQWHRLATATTPPFGDQWLLDDPVRNRKILVGDDLITGFATWEFDGVNWVARAPATSPPRRSAAAATFDFLRGRVVLFGGVSGVQPLADTWLYDGVTWTQVQVTAPTPRHSHSMVHDLVRDRIVLFGGFDTATGISLGDTWEFDGANWSQVNTQTVPPRRAWARMAYDVVRARTVMYGGFDFPNVLNDTWEFDGADWLPVATPHSPPPADPGWLLFDLATQRSRLVAGTEIWEYDGVDWLRLAYFPRPPAREAHGFVYEVARRQALLFGGRDSGGQCLGDTWELDGQQWRPRVTPMAPAPRQSHALAQDIDRQRTILFGGQDSAGAFADTWAYDGTAWQQLAPAHSPAARWGHAMAYDDTRRRVVLFGGTTAAGDSSETWEYDGADWAAINTATQPAARLGHAMVYDAARGKVVLFGGATAQASGLADTWTYDGAAWTSVLTASPPYPRAWHAMAYDPVRGRTLLFGQGGAQGTDTWEFDGANWRPAGAASPPSGIGSRAVLDIENHGVVMFGGGDLGGRGNSNLAWNYVAAPQATWTRYGIGCAGRSTPATLDAAGPSPPALGTSFGLQMHGLPAQPGVVVLLFGVRFASRYGLHLPIRLGALGLPGCSAWVAPTATVLVGHAGTSATYTLPIPNHPALDGLVLATQGFALDPAMPSLIGDVTNAGILQLH